MTDHRYEHYMRVIDLITNEPDLDWKSIGVQLAKNDPETFMDFFRLSQGGIPNLNSIVESQLYKDVLDILPAYLSSEEVFNIKNGNSSFPTVFETMLYHLKQNKKINAIKEFRQYSGCNLRIGKDFVDAFYEACKEEKYKNETDVPF